MRESTMHRVIKKVLFTFLVALLFLPMIQQKITLVELKPLNGSFSTLENPYFSIDGWLKGEYQEDQQNYSDQTIGFRTFLVRLYNQLYYTVYNQARANGVSVGKENYLYEENYIKAYLGRDFIGYEKITEKVTKLQKITDTLRVKGIDLIVVLAPGKGSFYPEFIPEKYNPQNRSTTNYEVYREKILKTNIHFLDFHSLFRETKTTSPYPLFPKTGIHWSKYGEVLVADSILNYIASFYHNMKIPQIVIDTIETSIEMQDTDDDIEKGMNLLINIQDLEMGYPRFKVQKDSVTHSPRVLTIADSYYWGMFNWGLSRDAFNNGQFWYYNKQIYPDSYDTALDVEDIDIREEVEKNEVIILLSTDANLYKFAFGFIDQLYDSYFGSKKDSVNETGKKEERIQYYIHAIKETSGWIDAIRKNAQEETMSLSELIRKNAEYMVWKEENEHK